MLEMNALHLKCITASQRTNNADQHRVWMERKRTPSISKKKKKIKASVKQVRGPVHVRLQHFGFSTRIDYVA